MRIVTRTLAALALAAFVGLPAAGQDIIRGAKDTDIQPAEERSIIPINDLGILTFQTKDGSFKWYTDVRLLLTGGGYFGSSVGNQQANAVRISEFRLGLNFEFAKYWASQIDLKVSPGGSIEMNDMWVGYTGVDNMMFRVGQNKVPWGFYNLTSDRFISTVDRPAVVDGFKGGRKVGATWNGWGKLWTGALGAYSQGGNDEDANGTDFGYTYAGRFTLAPVQTKTALAHVGASAYVSTPKADSGDTFNVKVYDESVIDEGTRWVTGKIKFADKAQIWNVEAVGKLGPVTLQGEYAQYIVKRFGGNPNARVSGWYVEATWFPSGYARATQPNVGERGRVVPTARWGLVELVGRYSKINLNDFTANIKGGSGDMTHLLVNRTRTTT